MGGSGTTGWTGETVEPGSQGSGKCKGERLQSLFTKNRRSEKKGRQQNRNWGIMILLYLGSSPNRSRTCPRTHALRPLRVAGIAEPVPIHFRVSESSLLKPACGLDVDWCAVASTSRVTPSTQATDLTTVTTANGHVPHYWSPSRSATPLPLATLIDGHPHTSTNHHPSLSIGGIHQVGLTSEAPRRLGVNSPTTVALASSDLLPLQ